MCIFYKSIRIGQNGKEFQLYKFRSMVENADRFGGSSTAGDDKRLTKIGRILRKYKLDELPQLWNILKRDMNLIGWRPEVPQYLNTISREVLETKPGITGLATIWDYDEEQKLTGREDPDRFYEEHIMPKKRELELYYVRNKSLKLDIKILWLTFKKLFGR